MQKKSFRKPLVDGSGFHILTFDGFWIYHWDKVYPKDFVTLINHLIEDDPNGYWTSIIKLINPNVKVDHTPRTLVYCNPLEYKYRKEKVNNLINRQLTNNYMVNTKFAFHDNILTPEFLEYTENY